MEKNRIIWSLGLYCLNVTQGAFIFQDVLGGFPFLKEAKMCGFQMHSCFFFASFASFTLCLTYQERTKLIMGKTPQQKSTFPLKEIDSPLVPITVPSFSPTFSGEVSGKKFS